MSEKFTVEIISPINSIIKIDTNEVVIPSYEGEMGILKDHIPLITFLRPGLIKISGQKEKIFFAEEGIVEFKNDNLLILSSTAKDISKISKHLLKDLVDEAENKLNSDTISDKEKYLISYKIDTLNNII